MTDKRSVTSASKPPPYLGYGVHGLGGALMVQAPGLLLLIYMTDTLGIPAALAGMAMFIPRLLDVITDPLMGVVSDRTKSRWGRRRPYLLLGAIVTGVSASFLFTAPLYESVYARLAYVLIFYVMMVLGSTIFTIPAVAMASEMTEDYHERTKLMSMRTFFVFIGMITGGVLAPMVVLKAGGGLEGYALMSIVLGIAVGGSFLATFFGTRNVRFTEGGEKTLPIRSQIRIVLGNQPFKVLIMCKLIFAIGMGGAATLVPYYVRYILKIPDLLPMLWGVCQVGSMLSIPLWIMLAKRVEKHSVFKIGYSLLALGAVGFFTVGEQQSIWLVGTVFVIFGIGFAAVSLSSFAMLPDVIQWDAITSGSEKGGVFSGAFLAFEKCGFAIGALLAGAILGVAGYIESTGGDVTQPDNALLGIRVAIGVVPCVAMLIGLKILMGYPLTKQVLAEGASKLKGSLNRAEIEPSPVST